MTDVKVKIKRALISVSDKTGIIEMAKGLRELDIEIISTGGTAKLLEGAGIEVIRISDVTHFPEILDGRVKTLHPLVHGGLLAVRDKESHQQQMRENNIEPIDLVIVNLYPFKQVTNRPDVALDEAIENIDIGGPTMIRSAAKNYKYVTVSTSPVDYPELLKTLQENGGMIDLQTRFRYAVEAFTHTADYDTAISTYLTRRGNNNALENLELHFEKVQDLRYGENPHQTATFYRDPNVMGACVGNARQLHGKELSFNNIIDLNAALEIVKDFSDITATVIKHTNACGTATGETLAEAYRKALSGDPMSAFGGIIGVNREVDKETAEEIHKTFVEAVIAPSFTHKAIEVLTQKKNIRLLEVGSFDKSLDLRIQDIKRVVGGILVQDFDTQIANKEEMKVVTDREPTAAEWKELSFAWKICKHIKSNAILFAKDQQSVGVGAGQMSRVDAVKIAVEKAGDRTQGAVMASDAFFPFRDAVDEAAKAGITAIIQPGGSIHDEESIKAANEHGIAMIFTGMRHFKH